MATEPRSRRRQRKKVLRRNDGNLYDATEKRRITVAELRDYVRDGGLFEARRDETGADCTYEVLAEVVGVGLFENLVPGTGGGTLSGLGTVAGFGSGGGLAQLARFLGSGADQRGWEDREGLPRRSPRRRRESPGWEPDPDPE